MRRKTYIIFILVVCISILAFIVHFFDKNNDKLSIAEDMDVKISVQPEILLKSKEVILLTIKNIELDNVEFGLDYEMQIKDDGKWLQYYKPENIDDIVISLNRSDSYEQKIYLNESINLKLNKTYRIIKIINDKPYASNEFVLK